MLNFKLFKLFFLLLSLSLILTTIDAQEKAAKTSSSESTNESNTPSKTSTNSEASETPTKSGSSSKSSSTARIPSNAARGMIVFIEPPVAQNFIAGWSIGSVANMKWKYDNNLKIKPNNISIIAIRQEGGNVITYNIGLELPGDTTEYQWDMANFTADPNNPPLVESDNYKLYIYDTARSYLAGAPAGGLNPYTRQFRLYKAGNGGSNLCLTCLKNSSATLAFYKNSGFILSTISILIFLYLL